VKLGTLINFENPTQGNVIFIFLTPNMQCCQPSSLSSIPRSGDVGLRESQAYPKKFAQTCLNFFKKQDVPWHLYIQLHSPHDENNTFIA